MLHAKLAALENAEAALVAGSGMAAISATLLTVLAGGGHLIAQDCVYGGTHDLFVEELPRYGLAVDFVDGDEPATWREALRPNTRAIYVEAMSNPLLQVSDLNAAVDFSRERAGLDHRQHVREPDQFSSRRNRLRPLPS